MTHYIKVDSYSFDHIKKQLSIVLYFDLKEGYRADESGSLMWDELGWFGNLNFKSVAIDTENTFICQSEPSDKATIITPNDNGDVQTEDYNVLVNGVVIESTRLVWHLTIDLNNISTGVLGALESFENTLLYMYATVEGDYNGAGWHTRIPKTVMFTLYDDKALYSYIYNVLSLNKVSNSDCKKPCNCFSIEAANNIILLNGLEASLQMERWKEAAEFWKILHKHKDKNFNCNCR